jgi:prepilin-type N-terminal cleavage/methylation domain-containing protein
MSARARCRTSQGNRGEAGFTLVELVVTMAVMSIVATSVMSVAFRLFTTTNTVTNRRDVLTDGRQAIDQMTKQLRQAESVDMAGSNDYTLTFDSYVDGEAAVITWRVVGTEAPYTLEQSRDILSIVGDGDFAPLVSPLLCKADLTSPGCQTTESDGVTYDHLPFTYTSHGGVVDQVTIDLAFQTNTSSIDLISDVQLRNAEES